MASHNTRIKVLNEGNNTIASPCLSRDQGRVASRLHQRFVAWATAKGEAPYDRLVSKYRRNLFSGLKGTVLEIGPGCGASLRYIPKDITWVGVEPNPFMGRYLNPRLATFKKPALLKTSYAESLPMEDDSVDVVVSNLVLCSVKDLSKVLWEVLRVLKPGGSFRFWDHVAAPEDTLSRFLQDLLTPAWRIIADGCCMNRDILGYLQRAGFSKLEFRTYNVPLQFFLMANHIGGIGYKAG